MYVNSHVREILSDSKSRYGGKIVTRGETSFLQLWRSEKLI